MSANLSRNHDQRTFEEQVCLSDVNEQLALQFLVFINIALSFTTFVGNTLTLYALKKESILHPPSKLLYVSLASTDLCVGVILQPINVFMTVTVIQRYTQLCSQLMVVMYLVGLVLFGVSLCTMTAISIDRLLALLLRLRYRQVATLDRYRLLVALIWLLNILVTTMHFWAHFIFLWYGYVLITACFVASAFAYTTIHLVLRSRRSDPRPVGTNATLCNRTQYRRTVSTIIWVQLILAACFLPYGVVTILISVYGLSPAISLASRFLSALLYLNSTLNPFVYYWRINGVRLAIRGALRKICPISRVEALPLPQEQAEITINNLNTPSR
ncbi:adenosine receptor A3-like [Acropora millepora]|uniref:adenosine receptor A3-like n=1 Tax=Acropora millepora TaxID=45264 RepID=UPI001CF52B84|nr:adenosine receptor A3-like [Acropora millepora]